MATPEGEIKKQIIDWLKAKQIFYWVNVVARVPGNRGKMKTGTSDILGCFKGRMLAIEIKAKTGKLSDEQAEFIFAVRTAGGIAFVARSLDDVIQQLEAA